MPLAINALRNQMRIPYYRCLAPKALRTDYKPVHGDYDGDGKTDCAVYRTGTGAWFIIPSGGGAPYGMGWGGDASDKPVTMNLSSIE